MDERTSLWTVDRIEGDLAVLTDGSRSFDVPLAALPADVGDGWVLRVEFARDKAEEDRRRADLAKRMKARMAGDDGGDFSL